VIPTSASKTFDGLHTLDEASFGEDKGVQATFPYLDLDWVVSAREFIAR
jgi:hypothetical protein